MVDRSAAGLAYCAERGLDLWWLYVVAYRGRAALDRGRWNEAAEAAATVVRQPEGAPLLRMLGLTLLAVVRARRGDPDVWPPLDEARAIVAGKRDLQHLAPVALAHAEAAALTNRADEVRPATDEALALARERGAPWIVGELAFWRRRAGIDERCPPEAAEPFALHLSGDPVQAAARWSALGCPYEAALARADSDHEDGLRQALEELRRLAPHPRPRRGAATARAWRHACRARPACRDAQQPGRAHCP